jgi:hypothetical protein
VVLVMVLLMVAMVVLLLVVIGGNGVVDTVGNGGDGICDWRCWWWCKFLGLYLKWVGWAKQSHGSVQKLLVKRKRRVGWGSISGTWCM